MKIVIAPEKSALGGFWPCFDVVSVSDDVMIGKTLCLFTDATVPDIYNNNNNISLKITYINVLYLLMYYNVSYIISYDKARYIL